MTKTLPIPPRCLADMMVLKKAFSRLMCIALIETVIAGLLAISLTIFLLDTYNATEIPEPLRKIWYPNALFFCLMIGMWALIWLSPNVRGHFSTLAPYNKAIWAFEGAQTEYADWKSKRGGSLEAALQRLDIAGQWLEDLPEYKELRNQVLAAYKASGGTDG